MQLTDKNSPHFLFSSPIKINTLIFEFFSQYMIQYIWSYLQLTPSVPSYLSRIPFWIVPSYLSYFTFWLKTKHLITLTLFFLLLHHLFSLLLYYLFYFILFTKHNFLKSHVEKKRLKEHGTEEVYHYNTPLNITKHS